MAFVEYHQSLAVRLLLTTHTAKSCSIRLLCAQGFSKLVQVNISFQFPGNYINNSSVIPKGSSRSCMLDEACPETDLVVRFYRGRSGNS